MVYESPDSGSTHIPLLQMFNHTPKLENAEKISFLPCPGVTLSPRIERFRRGNYIVGHGMPQTCWSQIVSVQDE